MTRGASAAVDVDLMAPSPENDKKQVVGRQIWRVVPYAKKYPGRVFSGIFSNAMARMFDLMPFVAIGYSIDYFTINKMSGPELLQDFVIAIPGNIEIGYGFLIFLGFFFLAFFQGLSEYSWQTLGYKIQHDLRMDATKSIISMEASYYDCLLYTSPSPRDGLLSRMPSSA